VHPLVALHDLAMLHLRVFHGEEGSGVWPDRLVRSLPVAAGPARIGAQQADRADDRGGLVEHVLGAAHDRLRHQQLVGESAHGSVLVLQREQVVLARGHDRVRAGSGEPAGVAADDVEQRAVGLDEAPEGRLEVGHLVRLGGDGDGVDARPPRSGDERGGPGADEPAGRADLRVLGLHERLVQARQRRHLAVERHHLNRQTL
jgi:hypothetical protein